MRVATGGLTRSKTQFDPKTEVVELEDTYRIFSVTRGDVEKKDDWVEQLDATLPLDGAAPVAPARLMEEPPVSPSPNHVECLDDKFERLEQRLRRVAHQHHQEHLAEVRRVKTLLWVVLSLLVLLLAIRLFSH